MAASQTRSKPIILRCGDEASGPVLDQAVSALIEDLYDRGLDEQVMVVVSGEFGRTPRISYVASSGGGVASAEAGIVQPGRDHWPRATSILFAGVGIRTGQVIGATDQRGEDATQRQVGRGDFLATLYAHWAFGLTTLRSATSRDGRFPSCKKGRPSAS